jgi:tripartite-type tricarboxylate transporter receptor subunit TctC
MRHTFGCAVRIAFIPAVLASQPVGAQGYPAREIRSICNFAAGSGADILVRYYSDRLAVSGQLGVDGGPDQGGNRELGQIRETRQDRAAVGSPARAPRL